MNVLNALPQGAAQRDIMTDTDTVIHSWRTLKRSILANQTIAVRLRFAGETVLVTGLDCDRTVTVCGLNTDRFTDSDSATALGTVAKFTMGTRTKQDYLVFEQVTLRQGDEDINTFSKESGSLPTQDTEEKGTNDTSDVTQDRSVQRQETRKRLARNNPLADTKQLKDAGLHRGGP